MQGKVTAADIALAMIEAYNNGDGSSPAALTTADYLAVGVQGISSDNLAAVNAQVLAAGTGDADTVPEILGQLAAANSALAKVEAYNNGDGSSPAALIVADYVAVGVTGVSVDNLAAVNAQVLAAAIGDTDIVSEIQGKVSAADSALAVIEAYNNGDGSSPAPLVLADYTAVGITGISFDNLLAVNAQVLAAANGAADTVAEIQSLVSTANAALASIEAYNNGDGTTPAALLVTDYTAAGITGVSVDNLASVNAQILAAAPAAADTVSEIQTLVTIANAALAKIEAYNNGDGTSPVALTLQDYLDAGISGVSGANLAALNVQVLAAASGETDTVAEIQTKVSAANTALAVIEAYNNGDGSTPAALTIADYLAVGVQGVSADNLAAVNAQVLAATSTGADTVPEILAQLAAANVALSKIEAFNNGDGSSPAPLNIADYEAVGVTGVSVDNLAAVNAQVLAALSTQTDTVAEIQSKVSAADTALAFIEAYNNGDGSTPAALSLDDYASAGISGVSNDNLLAVNAQILAAIAGASDTVAKILLIVSIADSALAKIEAFNNGDGSTPAPLINSDFVAVGITGVSVDNLAAVNAQILNAASGGADSVLEIQGLVTAADVALAGIEAYNNGDGTTPAAPSVGDYFAAGIGAVDANNVAAVNYQVLISAVSETDTVAKIQAKVVVANAAIALIESYNNGDGISPAALTVQDYLNAGVEGVSAEVLTAFNARVLIQSSGATDSTPEIQNLFDSMGPIVLLVAITGASGAQNSRLNSGDILSVELQMSKITSVSGIPQLSLNIGGTLVLADYQSGDGSTTLIFSYQIVAGDDSDGISIDANSLSLNGGTLQDSSANAALLAHPALADDLSYLVDNTALAAPASLTIDQAIDKINSIELAAGIVVEVALDALTQVGDTVTVTLTKGGSSTQISHQVILSELGSTASITIAAGLFSGDDDYDISATLTDLAGNVGPASAITTVQLDTLGAAAPGAITGVDRVGGPDTPIVEGSTIDDAKPGISGSAEALATVRIYDNGSFVTEVTAQADGSWSYTFETRLSNGDHVITVKQIDQAGNPESAASTALSFSVDSQIVTLENEPLVFTSEHFNAIPEVGQGVLIQIILTELPTEGKLQLFDGALWNDLPLNSIVSLADIAAAKLRFAPDKDETGHDGFNSPGVGEGLNDYASFNYTYSDGTNASVIHSHFIDVIPLDTDGDGVADKIDLDDDNDGILDSVENATHIGTNAYNIGSSSFDGNYSVSSQESVPTGITFNDDGTKMYIIGTNGVEINEYVLTNAYDLAIKTLVNTFSVSTWESTPQSIRFSADGSKMFILGSGSDSVNEFALSSAFDTFTASFNTAYLLSGQDTVPTEMVFSTDGTKLFMLGDTGNDIQEYLLQSPYNLAGMGVLPSTFAVGSQEGTLKGLAFSYDGSQMFVTGSASDQVHVYNLNTPYSVASSAGFAYSFDIAGNNTSPSGLSFNADGTQLFITNDTNGEVSVYDMDAGFIANDVDGDGVINALDLDSDNDGISDNLEGQTTQGYQAASGIDANGDGLDDVYGSGTAAVDTDGDGIADFIDVDSDNDGVLDIAERGGAGPDSVTDNTDSDGDGLLDIFEGANVNDGYQLGDQNVSVDAGGAATAFTFTDSDADAAVDGSLATGLGINFDFR